MPDPIWKVVLPDGSALYLQQPTAEAAGFEARLLAWLYCELWPSVTVTRLETYA